MISERPPIQTRLATLLLHSRFASAESISLFAAQNGDAMAASSASNQVGKHLRAAKRIGESVVSYVQNTGQLRCLPLPITIAL